MFGDNIQSGPGFPGGRGSGPDPTRIYGDCTAMVRNGKGLPGFNSSGFEEPTSRNVQNYPGRTGGRQGGPGRDYPGRSTCDGPSGGSGKRGGDARDQAPRLGTIPGWKVQLTDEMSGIQLAEVLKFLAERVQTGLDEGSSIIDQLKLIAQRLEEQDE